MTNTFSKEDFIQGLKKLCLCHNIVSISGESGTGKTTLALFMIGKSLTDQKPYHDSCIWIQAGEKFPLKRLLHMFQAQKEESEYIKQNIFVIPKENPIRTYGEQYSVIKNIINPSTILPPSLRYIIIDDISHHLRFQITQYKNFSDVSSLLNTFYDTLLMPLILFCKRNRISLILIHEITYVPSLSCTKPFFYKLYDRLKTIDIALSNIVKSSKKKIQIFYDGYKWEFLYIIEHTGITFC